MTGNKIFRMDMQVCLWDGRRIAAGIFKAGLFFAIALVSGSFKGIGDGAFQISELAGILAQNKHGAKQYGTEFSQAGFGSALWATDG